MTGDLYYKRWKLFLECLEENRKEGEMVSGIGNLTKDWEGSGENEGRIRLPSDSDWYQMEKEWADLANIPETDEADGTEVFEMAYRKFICGDRSN